MSKAPLHVDHCGWNTQLRDGRWVPTFPNAKYVFSKAEHDHGQARRGGAALMRASTRTVCCRSWQAVKPISSTETAR